MKRLYKLQSFEPHSPTRDFDAEMPRSNVEGTPGPNDKSLCGHETGDGQRVEIRALQRAFPGRPDVLARETAYYEFKASMLEKICALPKTHKLALRKVMYR